MKYKKKLSKYIISYCFETISLTFLKKQHFTKTFQVNKRQKAFKLIAFLKYFQGILKTLNKDFAFYSFYCIQIDFA